MDMYKDWIKNKENMINLWDVSVVTVCDRHLSDHIFLLVLFNRMQTDTMTDKHLG